MLDVQKERGGGMIWEHK